MKEKLKNLMSKKIFILIGVLVVAVAVVTATLSQDKEDEKGKNSSKKQMLENYAKDGQTEEETTISLNDYTVDTVFQVNKEEIESLIKATIDYAMVSDRQEMGSDSYSYWKGVQIGVSRMYDLECYKDKITEVDDGRNKWYQVDETVVEEIGMAMTGYNALDWVEGEEGLEGFVEYDLTTKSYLFKKYKNIDYYIDYEYEVTGEDSLGTTGAIYATTSLSAEYPSAYAVKDYKMDFSFPAYNASGIYIDGTMETNSENKVSQFAKCYWDEEVNVEIALDSDLFMENVAMPYVNFRMECEDKNEAMWLTVYNAVYHCLEVKYGATPEYYSLWPHREVSDGGDKEYMVVGDYNILDVLFVFKNKMEYEIDFSTIPEYLRELITYEEESGELRIEIDEQYIKEFDYEYAATEIDDGKCSVYGKMKVKGEGRLFSFVLNGNGMSNFQVAIEDLKY